MFFSAPPKSAPLNHIKVTQSLQGVSVPIVFGTARVSAKLVFDADLVAHPESASGKAKGGKSGMYAYTGTFIGLLCEGPILGVSTVWDQQGKLPLGTYTTPSVTVPTAPAPSALTYQAGGAMAARTYWACTTLMYGSSESAPSTAYSWAIPADNLAVIDTPPSYPTGATGYNVYVGTSESDMTLQNASPLPLSTQTGTWVEPTTGLTTTGRVAPVNATVPAPTPPNTGGGDYGDGSGVKGPNGPFKRRPTF